MKDCIFCKIAKKELPAKLVFENEKFVAFNDINPKAPIHILVLPKAHFPSVKELSADLSGNLIDLAKKISEEKKLNGYKLVFNVGQEGGQIVEHVHLHLLGGWVEKPKNLNV